MTMRPRGRFVPTLENLETRDLMAAGFATSWVPDSFMHGQDSDDDASYLVRQRNRQVSIDLNGYVSGAGDTSVAGVGGRDNRQRTPTNPAPAPAPAPTPPAPTPPAPTPPAPTPPAPTPPAPTPPPETTPPAPTPPPETTPPAPTPPPESTPPAPTPSSDPVGAAVPPSDWFEVNIGDAALRSLARNLGQDGSIGRNDMLAVFTQVRKDNTVTATEFGDLQDLVRDGNVLGMPDYVRVLANKVVNGDLANQFYAGAALGNLRAGSTGTHLNNLVNEWFLGLDRPIAQDSYGRKYSYKEATGSLFVNGVSYTDIRQGALNDCYFLVGLAETAARTPSVIQSMFIDNGDKTFTVRFYHDSVADYVTVDRYLPVSSTGMLVFASKGYAAGSASTELWVALAEKAYAQLAASGWSRPTATSSYKGLDYGYNGTALAHVSGRTATIGMAMDFNTVVSAWNAGQLIGFASKSKGTATNVVANHGYALVGYNSTTKTFTLANPWGTAGGSSKPATLNLTWTQITTSFSYWDRAI